ncbi:MAG: IMP dehydrogenase, partial [bacterium]
MNQYMEQFMEQFKYDGLTFDDVSLVTDYADFMPDETVIASKLTTRISVNIPIVSAAMDTVTEQEMALSMAMLGGIGIIHRNLTQVEQARQVAMVKHHLNGLIKDPIVFRDTDTLDIVLERKAKKAYAFSGFPILDANNNLVGILSAADIKFARDEKVRVAEIMTSQVISAPEGTSLQDSYQIMKKHKIGKLPLIKAGKLTGLYSFADVKTLVEKSDTMINRDEKYRLRVGAAVGTSDHERIAALASEDVDVIVVDTAHGDSKNVLEMISWTKKNFPRIDVIGGNIATGEAALRLRNAGADGVKVGIGPGSICTTRVVAGVGVPQITAIYNCAKALQGSIPIIADGGIRHSGDVPKAIVAGADTVMIGGLLAGTEESPGEKIFHQGRQYVAYRGMGSLGAMKESQGSRGRYMQS